MKRGLAALAFAGLSVFIVRAYCYAMVGKLDPLMHHPEEFVIRPLTVITAVVSLLLYPLLVGQRSRWTRGLMLYLGFVLISAIYGVYLWYEFPDGSPFSVLVAVIGGHIYGWPPFIMLFLVLQALDRWLFRPL